MGAKVIPTPLLSAESCGTPDLVARKLQDIYAVLKSMNNGLEEALAPKATQALPTVERRLDTTKDIDLTDTGDRQLIKVNVKTIITCLVLLATDIDSVTTNPTVGLYIATAGDLLESVALKGVTRDPVTANLWRFPIQGRAVIARPSEGIILSRDVAATATTFKVRAELWGYEL